MRHCTLFLAHFISLACIVPCEIWTYGMPLTPSDHSVTKESNSHTSPSKQKVKPATIAKTRPKQLQRGHDQDNSVIFELPLELLNLVNATQPQQIPEVYHVVQPVDGIHASRSSSSEHTNRSIRLDGTNGRSRSTPRSTRKLGLDPGAFSTITTQAPNISFNASHTGTKQQSISFTQHNFDIAILIIGLNRVLDKSPGHIFLRHKLAFLINPIRSESRRTELFMCTERIVPSVSQYLNATAWHVASENETCEEGEGQRCNSMFRRARSCFEFARSWSSQRQFSFDWYIRDRPDTVLMRPVPPIKCLPDKSAVYAPPRWVGEHLFPELCSLKKQLARKDRIEKTGISMWAGRGYREYCSNNFTFGWKAPRKCVTISDEFALIPAKSAVSYFGDSWYGMSEDRETPPWSSKPAGDPTTKRHCCLFMRCHPMISMSRCDHCLKWAPEGVLTRQLFLAGTRIGVLELDTVHLSPSERQEKRPRHAKLVPEWRWLRSNSATSLQYRDKDCRAAYPLTPLV